MGSIPITSTSMARQVDVVWGSASGSHANARGSEGGPTDGRGPGLLLAEVVLDTRALPVVEGTIGVGIG